MLDLLAPPESAVLHAPLKKVIWPCFLICGRNTSFDGLLETRFKLRWRVRMAKLT